MLSNSILHYTILQNILENGYAPSVADLANTLGVKEDKVIEGLYKLQDYHGVVLHPNEPKIWVIHPFSLAPTNFYVESDRGGWWGNCAWCSLGVAALLDSQVKITTTIGGETKQIEINIVDGEIHEKGYYIHFPTPMKNAWDNVIYTCSNMLIFENEQQIDEWALKHHIPKGDIQPIEKIWNFSRKWYGNHLDPQWTKWTIEEAKQMFREFDLSGKIWELEDSGGRF
ncbi:MAG: alkylmercury lyase family protein [Bacteroidota bacterium]